MFAALIAFCLGLAVAAETSVPSIHRSIDGIVDAVRGPAIDWDDDSLVRISPPGQHRASYPRLTELGDGALLCVYEADGSVFASRSTDRGNTWAKPVPVAWQQHGINMAAPEVLELHDGSILACYNPRPYIISGTRNFGIRTRKSYDGGRTWIHGRLIYEGRHKFTDGCWEPAPIQMPDGEIRVFFANEAIFANADHNDQNISMLRSRDGGMTWTTEPEVISYKRHGRDGMPVPLRLKSGELVCAIEQTISSGQLQPALLRLSRAGETTKPLAGDSPHREAPLADRIDPTVYAGAPYLRQVSTGETLLSYQGTENRRGNHLHDADMKVWIGDTNARSFRRRTVPFKVPPTRAALWSSLAILHDDTIIAITSTNAYNDKWEIWMIKGRILNGQFCPDLPNPWPNFCEALLPVVGWVFNPSR